MRSGYWMRLVPTALRQAPQVGAGDGEILARLRALLGCRWVWWAPDAGTAWGTVLDRLEIGASHRVHVPAGINRRVEDQVVARGARLVEVDLKEDSGAPIWPDADVESDGKSDVFILDHRFGLPSPLPPQAGLVLEDATAAVGGALDNRPVGSIGQAAVVRFGNHPFSRPHGALVATNDPVCVDRLQRVAVLAESGGERPDLLAAEVWALDEWNDGCRAAASIYNSVWRGLTDVPLRPVLPAEEAVATYSAYLIAVPDPTALASDLGRQGIEARRPLNGRIKRLLGEREDVLLPGARAFYRRVLRLPNHPELDVHALLHVADAVRRFLQMRSDV